MPYELYGLSLLAICLSLWVTRAATRTYSVSKLNPVIYPDLARTDAVVLAPGTYAAGTVLGQATTLTAANDVQTITITGTPTGGTFRLSFAGYETGAITFSTTAATLAANITAALEALAVVGTGNVTTSASVTVPAITFQGDLAARYQPLIAITDSSLTGGTDPAMTIAHTTPGRGLGGQYRAYDDAQTDGTNIARAVLEYATYVTPNGKHYMGTREEGLWFWNASAYIKGYFRTADLTGIDAAAVADLGHITHGAVGSLSNVATILCIE